MSARRHIQNPRDRIDDARLAINGITKPAILGRRTQKALCIACLAVITFGTLGPLGNEGHDWLAPAESWQWVPQYVPFDLNDLFTNLIVYIPVGIAFRLLYRKRGRRWWVDLPLGTVSAIVLSYATELLQQFMPARSASLADVYINSAAGFAGCLLAVPFQQAMRRLHAFFFLHMQIPALIWTGFGWLLTISTVLMLTLPWELRRPYAVFGLDEPLDLADPLRFSRFALFASVGFCMAAAGRAIGASAPDAVRRSVVHGAALAALLELSQTLLVGHVASLMHAVVATVGALAGAWTGVYLVRPFRRSASLPKPGLGDMPFYPSPPMRRLAGVLLIGLVLYLACSSLLSGVAGQGLNAEPSVCWVPFSRHFMMPFSRAMSDVLEDIALYGVLSVLCMVLTAGRGRGVALLLLLGLVGTTELARTIISPAGADITNLLVAAFSWFVAGRLWRSIYPRRGPSRRISRGEPELLAPGRAKPAGLEPYSAQ